MKIIYKILFSFSFVVILLIAFSCKNPFAPAYDENYDSSQPPISDLTTIEGVFQNVQYAYTFKDTLIYGALIAPDFIFTYRDYEQGIDVSWGRDEEMQSTNGLFTYSQRLDLIWNNIVSSTVDSLNANIIRSFNLNVTLNPTDVLRADGRVNLSLKQNPQTKVWQIVRWVDESNF